MRSRVVLKNCLLIGTLVFAASGTARATVDGSSGGSASVGQAPSGIVERVLDLFHHFGLGSSEQAQPTPQKAADKLVSMTPEQREQMRDQIRQQWQSASPEERQKRREEFHERWESATPEQRDQLRERAKERWEQLSPEQRQQIRQHIEDRSGRSSGAGGYGPGPGR